MKLFAGHAIGGHDRHGSLGSIQGVGVLFDIRERSVGVRNEAMSSVEYPSEAIFQ